MDNVLSYFVFPNKGLTAEESLYFRTKGTVITTSEGLFLSRESAVTLDSYFNGFFYSKYLVYTQIHQVRCFLQLCGHVEVSIQCRTSTGGYIELASVEVDTTLNTVEFPWVELSELPAGGVLFLKVKALSDQAHVRGGGYQTDLPPVQHVKVAAVICTFHREDYVKRNIELIKEHIWDNHNIWGRNFLDVFVVDNGKSLHLDHHPNLKVFANKNYGGSGGFTRGLIEAYLRKDIYTHVLFMDDDISFETEIINKTLQILRYAKKMDRPLCIGGQMLIEDAPTIQFESGAFYRNGRLVGMNKGLDLSELPALLENDKENNVQYNAWWYCCIPLGVIDKFGFPLPFFIKLDDVEYGLRINAHILLVNGIGVWHQSFSQKYSPHLEYYIKRNELIVSAIYHNGDGVFKSVWKLLRSALKAMLLGDPRVIDYVLWSGRDFLNGCELFRNLDDEAWNNKLLEHRKLPPKSRLRSLVTDPYRLLKMIAAFCRGYSWAQQDYLLHIGDLTSLSFWESRLEIDSSKYGGTNHEEI